MYTSYSLHDAGAPDASRRTARLPQICVTRRASNWSELYPMAFDRSLTRYETSAWEMPNAFDASFWEPKIRHDASPTRRISMALLAFLLFGVADVAGVADADAAAFLFFGVAGVAGVAR